MEEQGELIFKMQKREIPFTNQFSENFTIPNQFSENSLQSSSKTRSEYNSKQKETLHYEVYKSDSQCSPIFKMDTKQKSSMKNEIKIDNSCLCRKEFYNQLLNTRTHTHTQFIEQKTLRKDIENNTETKLTS